VFCLGLDVDLDFYIVTVVAASSIAIETGTAETTQSDYCCNGYNHNHHWKALFLTVTFTFFFSPTILTSDQSKRYRQFLIKGAFDIVIQFCLTAATVTGRDFLIDTISRDIAICGIGRHDECLRLGKGTFHRFHESLHSAFGKEGTVGTGRITRDTCVGCALLSSTSHVGQAANLVGYWSADQLTQTVVFGLEICFAMFSAFGTVNDGVSI
jgi:hypothetical protein